MKKIAVMTDSSADLDEELAKQLGLYVIRLPLIIDDKQYLEGTEISLEEFIDKMKQGAIVKTSSPLLGMVIEAWEQLLKEYDEIIYLPVSSGLSGSYNTACALAQNYDDRITVIDSKFVCYPLTKLCLEVKEMIAKGYSSKQIKEIIESQAEMWACLMPQDLNALKRGGRISPAVAALGNLLKIVPLLKVENGAIDVQEKVRTHKKAYDRAIQICTEMENKDDYCFMVVDADCSEAAQYIAKSLSEIVHQEVEIHKMHAIIMSHTGPGTVACGWYRKLKY
ncbi:MAG: DegV family protein [Erysipelotrichaceae bacterium]|nr:DegV family protein [Erysipelotrichaceae bacterium]